MTLLISIWIGGTLFSAIIMGLLTIRSINLQTRLEDVEKLSDKSFKLAHKANLKLNGWSDH